MAAHANRSHVISHLGMVDARFAGDIDGAIQAPLASSMTRPPGHIAILRPVDFHMPSATAGPCLALTRQWPASTLPSG